jgi:pyrroloquinoline quinone biosynthesis protein B
MQITNFSALCPHHTSSRNTPIEGVLLTDADLDHALGLLVLREGSPLQIYSSAQIRRSLQTGLTIGETLQRYYECHWQEVDPVEFELPLMNGSPSGLNIEAIFLNAKAPRHAPEGHAYGHRLAWVIRDERTKGGFLYAPAVGTITLELIDALGCVDGVLFDGTFYYEDEMIRAQTGAAAATEMEHIPICESLAALARSPAMKKYYTHINNTNPVLRENSIEHRSVRQLEIGIAFDGLEFQL